MLAVYMAIRNTFAFHSCRAPLQVFHQGRCFEPCKPGYIGEDGLCVNRYSSNKLSSYTRDGSTSPISCHPSSFRRNAPSLHKARKSFTMIILNDPQIIWWMDPPGAKQCGGDKDCKQRAAEEEAHAQVRAMNSIQTLGSWPGSEEQISSPLGVIINGDLTQYFHPHEFDLFEKYYVLESNAPHTDVLRYPLFLGLGNHDYANNLNDCWWPRGEYLLSFTNGCAQRAVDYIRSIISCKKYSSFPRGVLESFDNGSLAYSWNYEGYHFIQLHNYPSYQARPLGISKSMEWLKGDLRRATMDGRKIIINLHDLSDSFQGIEREEFSEILEQANVVAIFCGHIINGRNLGFQQRFGSVPVFRGGHGGEVNRKRFLLVQFAPKYLRVLVISTFNGKPNIEKGPEGVFDKTIVF